MSKRRAIEVLANYIQNGFWYGMYSVFLVSVKHGIVCPDCAKSIGIRELVREYIRREAELCSTADYEQEETFMCEAGCKVWQGQQ